MGDEFHGADFGGAGEGTGGEGGAEEVEGILVGGEFGRDIGDEVHDVGVAFNDHEVADLDGAGEGDAAEFISAEVHEHEMFGAFFFVAEEAVGEVAIFLFVGAAGAGTGDWAEGGGAVFESDHRFGGGTGENGIAEAEEVHVGGGVDEALGAVKAEEVGGRFPDEFLGNDGLDDVAADDMGFDGGDHIAEGLGIHDGVWGCGDSAWGGVGCRGLRGWGWVCEGLEEGIELVFGVVVGGRGILAWGKEREEESGQGMADIIEDDEGVWDDEIGERFFGGEEVWNAGFEKMDRFVGEVTDESAAEAGGSWGSGKSVLVEEGAEDGEGVMVVGDTLFVHALSEDDGVAIECEAGVGGEAEDGEAAPSLTAFDAFEEEERIGVGQEAGEDGDGGIEIGEDFGTDGDDVGVACEREEGFARGESA